MQIKMNIDKTAAIKAGLAGFGRMTVEIDLAQLAAEDRELLAEAPTTYDGTGLDVVGWGSVPSPDLAGLQALLGARRAEIARKKGEAEKREAQRLADCAEVAQQVRAGKYDEVLDGAQWRYCHLMPDGPHYYVPGGPWDWSVLGDLATVRVLIEEELARRQEAEAAARKREAAAGKEREEKEKAAREAVARANEQGILALLRERGTPSQVERFEHGVLPEDEIKAVVREALMGGLDGWPLYERIGDHVAHVKGCLGDCGIEYRAEDLASYGECQWAALRQARALAPDCLVSARLNRAWAACNRAEETRRVSILVQGELHGVKVSRSYAMPAEIATPTVTCPKCGGSGQIAAYESVTGSDPRD